MTKNLKLNIKNTQIANALNLKGIKSKLKSKTDKKKADPPSKKSSTKTKEKESSTTVVKKTVTSTAKDKDKQVSKPVIKNKPITKPIGPIIDKKVEYQKTNSSPTPVKKEKPKPLALGPTGRHIDDILPPKKKLPNKTTPSKIKETTPYNPDIKKETTSKTNVSSHKDKAQGKTDLFKNEPISAAKEKSGEYKDLKSYKHSSPSRRNKVNEFSSWRKKRSSKPIKEKQEVQPVVRPTELEIRLPITIKDLAIELKVKASEVITKLFMQGLVVTLNDHLDDETTVLLIGDEFNCKIEIDTTEEEKIRITDKSIHQEIKDTSSSLLKTRPPIITFMGHVDHGKTSLIDHIRQSQIASGEAGAITQHIGAFYCKSPSGNITILDTPGHEAFTSMRARGSSVTDIVVLVIAGDEGIKQQTVEAIQHAKASEVTIIVAINKCDKQGFDAENVYRQLSEQDLLPEAWGGEIITVNCSASTGEGINQLIEMILLQAELLELKANPAERARGRVLESEMHKGMGITATVLVQNGSLKKGDSMVFDQVWGYAKTIKNEFGKNLQEAPPSFPVKITGLSGMPEAGHEFIVVENDKEAKEIAEKRMEQYKSTGIQHNSLSKIENFLKQEETFQKKLNIIVKADVQGSLEALKGSLLKLESDKVKINIIYLGIGEISESDVTLASASNAVILGFHSQVESHAENLIKKNNILVRLHDIIYHAVDDIKSIMKGTLDKISKEYLRGRALVKATFKVSQLGVIAGCEVLDGNIHRNYNIKIKRDGEVIATAPISSLKRDKDDVKEVKKGYECGILMKEFSKIKPDDILEAYEIIYLDQEL